MSGTKCCKCGLDDGLGGRLMKYYLNPKLTVCTDCGNQEDQRRQFAAMAMQSMISNVALFEELFEEFEDFTGVTKASVAMADALIAELNRKAQCQT